MNLDTDERMLPDGQYRYAENVIINDSEGSDVGSVQNSYSNKKLTNIHFGKNVKTLGKYEDEFRDKIYWLVKSDSGCYLLEWDNPSESVAFVLKDTRPIGSRVFDLKDDFLCTGFEKIINDDINNDLIILTDNNMQPLCINVERAKSYGENGFEEEDILLIKKPPRFAPVARLFYTSEKSNNIEEKFISFAYRYQYLDNEWSALSSFTNYKFSPNPYKIDYYTLDNLGMTNAFNAVEITFNTGDKRVKNIQIIAKESNSNNLYIIESFNKDKEGYNHNDFKKFVFSNNKVYKLLPEKELWRSFDNVPRKAKALTNIGNRPIFGNYLEGYNLEDINGVKVRINHKISLKSDSLKVDDLLNTTKSNIPGTNTLIITNPNNYPLKKNSKITFILNVTQQASDILCYNKIFQYVLLDDYLSLNDLFLSSDFINFIETINSNYLLNNTFSTPSGYTKDSDSEITIIYGANVGLSVSPSTYINAANTILTVNFVFKISSYVSLSSIENASSCKSNRDYALGIEYLDKYNRKTTTLTAIKNTIYIPNEKSEYKNTLQIQIRNKPPYWADRFKIVVKSQPLTYHTITVNNYYIEGAFVWIRLEGNDKDKVKLGEYLILKKTNTKVQGDIIKTKILEVSSQPKDFIVENTRSEPSGFYIKIKPSGFSMNENNNITIDRHDSKGSASKKRNPTCYLDLFTDLNATPKNQPILAGSSIHLTINSSFNYKSGASVHLWQQTFEIQRDYIDIEDWYNDILLGRSMPASGDGGNYLGKVFLVTGYFNRRFVPDANGKKYLMVTGLESGNLNGDITDIFDGAGKSGTVDAWISLRKSSGDYIFETEPKKSIDQDLFYETEQTFEIINNQHKGNVQDQDLSLNNPAIISLDFFNCYAQGNGTESYAIKDAFNKPSLNIDLRPTTTITEEYTEVLRFADLTYGEPYVESTGKNGINEFNLATANYKQLDKNYGSVQKLLSRDNDLVVLQEEKTSKVMFGKDILYNADGTSNLSSVPDVLGQQVTYLGENGCQNPESVAVYDYQIFFTNARRGVVQRLSIDGVTDIVTGMVDWFRDKFIINPSSKKIGGFDPYFKQYVLSIGDEIPKILQLQCNNIITKLGKNNPFVYDLKLNDSYGNIVLNYNITLGSVTIQVLFNGVVTVASNVTGIGSLTIPRDTLLKHIAQITITPVTAKASYEITNNCPIGPVNHYYRQYNTKCVS
ncbi:fibronectin type III domain-containing protein [Flavobacterium psychrophilum]|uniref:Fibronectin type III domain-containing protein n=1 Tax=Flavobacterium psychrophilum TaxID=96345 RepID=A0A7U2R908_FLAPS|nr:fibronectin type III domain-containing protein [Flavobacterium psychrophilum]QRE03515.1 fibronectin type III domain-containing protein [Flavobacterium psychrophilum]